MYIKHSSSIVFLFSKKHIIEFLLRLTSLIVIRYALVSELIVDFLSGNMQFAVPSLEENEVEFISKEISRTEPKYINIHSPIDVPTPPLTVHN